MSLELFTEWAPRVTLMQRAITWGFPRELDEMDFDAHWFSFGGRCVAWIAKLEGVPHLGFLHIVVSPGWRVVGGPQVHARGLFRQIEEFSRELGFTALAAADIPDYSGKPGPVARYTPRLGWERRSAESLGLVGPEDWYTRELFAPGGEHGEEAEVSEDRDAVAREGSRDRAHGS